MIRDITIGQYYPVESVIHRLDPRVKIIMTFIYLISLFIFDGFAAYLIVTVFLVTLIVLSHVPLSYMMKGLKPILILLLFTAVCNIFFTTGDVLVKWDLYGSYALKITRQGLERGVFMVLRLIYLVLGSSILTYTTTPNKLTDGLEHILHPLNKIKVPVHDVAMMMSLALRFIPILLEETNRIIQAQSARGASFEEGKLMERMKAMVSILVPLLVSSTRRAYDLALAMEARCYQGGEGRTKMCPLKYEKRDHRVYVMLVVYILAVYAVNRFVPF